jgi:sugar/nucleoside kinase (ribokinase family)
MTTVVTVTNATRVLRVVGVSAGLAGLTAALAAPVHADWMGNAFLRALTNAGVPVSQPDSATALGKSVCPMLVEPGGSFDSVIAAVADGHGMSHDAAGVFTIVAIATYCPAVLAPLLTDRPPA